MTVDEFDKYYLSPLVRGDDYVPNAVFEEAFKGNYAPTLRSTDTVKFRLGDW